ncbi:hypothetical protein EZV62_018906 [Acer yangbiense]|uniref:Uncharacterized protein n=1 Tax=Acer yangbiense TaxID=1000413 RepID=A0A5C7H9C9_9ROSI|nr:hypothetical protein EZV62_018906 [Acer yangbiense]
MACLYRESPEKLVEKEIDNLPWPGQVDFINGGPHCYVHQAFFLLPGFDCYRLVLIDHISKEMNELNVIRCQKNSKTYRYRLA